MSSLACPVCSTGLHEVERQGVVIDTCPKCRGVWLDRGELEKLAARLARDPYGEEQPPRTREPRRDYDDNQSDRNYSDRGR